MILVTNDKHFLSWNEDTVYKYHVYQTVNSYFSQEVWRGMNLNTKALQKFFTEEEVSSAKTRRDNGLYRIKHKQTV